MSSILLEGSSDPLFEVQDADGGLRIVGQTEESNLFVIGGAGSDVVSGGSEGDIIETGMGDDIAFGQSGDDFLDGGEGDDVLVGGQGDDVIIGGAGSDTIIGGEGTDVFEFFAEDFAEGDLDIVKGFADDVIAIKGVQSVEYDSTTGMVSVDGEEAIKLDEGTDVSITETDDGFTLF
ncbi:MAG: calcium-binding protein [Xenococcaceae cyanobacterium]